MLQASDTSENSISCYMVPTYHNNWHTKSDVQLLFCFWLHALTISYGFDWIFWILKEESTRSTQNILKNLETPNFHPQIYPEFTNLLISFFFLSLLFIYIGKTLFV